MWVERMFLLLGADEIGLALLYHSEEDAGVFLCTRLWHIAYFL